MHHVIVSPLSKPAACGVPLGSERRAVHIKSCELAVIFVPPSGAGRARQTDAKLHKNMLINPTPAPDNMLTVCVLGCRTEPPKRAWKQRRKDVQTSASTVCFDK